MKRLFYILDMKTGKRVKPEVADSFENKMKAKEVRDSLNKTTKDNRYQLRKDKDHRLFKE